MFGTELGRLLGGVAKEIVTLPENLLRGAVEAITDDDPEDG